MTNGPLTHMTNAIQSAANEFSACEGIQFDAEVCTPEDQQMDAIKKRILKKLQVRFDRKFLVRTS
jgi:hypothetical protein